MLRAWMRRASMLRVSPLKGYLLAFRVRKVMIVTVAKQQSGNSLG